MRTTVVPKGSKAKLAKHRIELTRRPISEAEFRAGIKSEFFARIIKGSEQIWRTSETYKRKAGAERAIELLESKLPVYDITALVPLNR